MTRRHFIPTVAAGAFAQPEAKKFRISLAEWSIHRAIQGGKLTNLDFPRIARENGCDGLEFVNTLWASPTAGYLARLKRNMTQQNVQPVLIMCDDEGMMGHSDKATRLKAADNHRKWVDAAADLGCHSIRTNMHSDVTPKTPAEADTVIGYCGESFARLCDYASAVNINVLIENHWGLSSDPDAVVALMKKVGKPNFGTLPDFGNFPKEVDRYEAVKKLMTFAKGVSFKCMDFGPDGNETTIDMAKMMKIVGEAGYHGFVGIEYEGNRLSEIDGIKAAKAWLDKQV